MSRNSRGSFSASQRRDFTNNSIESLDEILLFLQSLSIDKLRELVQYVSAQIIPIDQGEFQPFFAWRAKQSSIDQDDIVIIETINQIINKKECEEKEEEPYPKVDDDEQEFVPDDEYLEQCENVKQINLRECVHKNPSQLSNHYHFQRPTSSLHKSSINLKSPSSVQIANPVIQSTNSNCNGFDNALSSAVIFFIGNCPFCPVTNLSFEGYLIHFNVVHPGSYLNPIQFWQQYNYALFIKNCNKNVLQSTTTSPPSSEKPQLQINLLHDHKQAEEHKQNATNDESNTSVQSSLFEPKFNNHAKGNCYISKEMIARMINESLEEFITNNDQQDEKLAFGYYKESVAIQINDKQINIFNLNQGLMMIIINIDIHFKSNGETMYLIARENDQQFRDRVRWSIVDFMSAQQIESTYGLDEYKLPQSSRNMPWYQKGIKKAPIRLSDRQIKKIVQYTRFTKLPSKTSKRRQTGNDEVNNDKPRISEESLKYYVEQSLKHDNDSPIHPVVVIKGEDQWIEWKRYIEIYDDNGYKQFVGISMRYYEANKQWRIECMDYDAGRVYYQHRLVSLSKDNQYNYSYNQLSKYITTTLEIYRKPRWY